MSYMIIIVLHAHFVNTEKKYFHIFFVGSIEMIDEPVSTGQTILYSTMRRISPASI